VRRPGVDLVSQPGCARRPWPPAAASCSFNGDESKTLPGFPDAQQPGYAALAAHFRSMKRSRSTSSSGPPIPAAAPRRCPTWSI